MNMFMELRQKKKALKKAEEERDLWMKRWNTIYNFTCKGAADAESNEEAYVYYQVKAAMEQVELYVKTSEPVGGSAAKSSPVLPKNDCQSEEE